MQRRNCIWGESIDPKGFDDREAEAVPKTTEEEDRIWKSLKSIFLFRGVSNEDLEKIIGGMQKMHFEAGETVVREGEEGDFLYVVDSGVFQAVREERVVHTYEDSSHFGELALMYDVPREATVFALTRGSLWALDRYSFRKTVLRGAHRKWELFEDLLSQVPLLRELTEAEKARLADSLVEVSYADGETVFTEGDGADSMFFVLSGKVKLVRSLDEYPEEEAKFLEEGEFFGELSLVARSPRSATASSVGKTSLARLDVEAFERLIGPCLGIIESRCSDHKEKLAQLFGSILNIKSIRK